MMTNKPTEIVPTQADRSAVANLARNPNSGLPPFIADAVEAGEMDWHPLVQAFAAHRLEALRTQGVTVAALYGYEAGFEEGKRLAALRPQPAVDEVELDHLAELLANFARDRFANTKELTWATMGEHSQQYFRDAVNVVRAALRPRSEREEIVAWLREQETERLEQIGHGLSGGGPQYDLGRATAYAHAADAIERGDFKEPSE